MKPSFYVMLFVLFVAIFCSVLFPDKVSARIKTFERTWIKLGENLE